MDDDDRMPRWVRALLIGGLVLLAVVVIVHLAGGGMGPHGG